MRPDPYKTDFAALRMLKLVHSRRSFSDVASALGVSQSVVSYTIDKLRSVLNDPLFLRQKGGIVPTDRCNAIVEELGVLMDRFDTLISPDDIVPEHIRHTFTLSCNFYERLWILPPVARTIRAVAPQVDLVVIPSSTSGPQQLLRGEADLLIGPMRPDGDTFYCRTLLSEEYVCILDPRHPLAADGISMEDYVAARHVVINYGDGWTSGYLAQLAALGLKLNRTITVPSPSGIQDLIAGTDLIATVPSRFAHSMSPRVRVATCPCPAPFDIDLIWSARSHGSPLHQWFRTLVVQAVKEGLS